MSVDPYTLQEETEERRQQRQRATGELRNGLLVLCQPTDDPAVVQQQHRGACLTKPYAKCCICPHSNFTLVFKKKNRALLDEQRRQLVMCPKWDDRGYVRGKPPDYYVSTDQATCELQPFDFCRDCPGVDELAQMEIDKKRDGWYSRWRRFTREEDE